MTNEETEELIEEQYGLINRERLVLALFCCAVIYFLGYMFT